MVECVDLRKCQQHYRVSREVKGSRDPWDLYLAGSRANICPWDEEHLAVCFHRLPNLAQDVLRRPWVIRERSQVGEGVEVNAVFHVRDLDKAAKVAGVEKRR